MRSNSIYSVVIGLNQEALLRPLVTSGTIISKWRKTNHFELLLCLVNDIIVACTGTSKTLVFLFLNHNLIRGGGGWGERG
jgi:hypothetical protein